MTKPQDLPPRSSSGSDGAFASGFAAFPLVPSAAKRDTAKSDEAHASRRTMRRTTGACRGGPADIVDFPNSISYSLYPLGRYASRTKKPLSFPTQGPGMVEAARVENAPAPETIGRNLRSSVQSQSFTDEPAVDETQVKPH